MRGTTFSLFLSYSSGYQSSLFATVYFKLTSDLDGSHAVFEENSCFNREYVKASPTFLALLDYTFGTLLQDPPIGSIVSQYFNTSTSIIIIIMKTLGHQHPSDAYITGMELIFKQQCWQPGFAQRQSSCKRASQSKLAKHFPPPFKKYFHGLFLFLFFFA